MATLFTRTTWVFSAIILVIGLIFEAVLAGSIWRWLAVRQSGSRPRKAGPWIAVALTLWTSSQGLHIWADAVGYSPVTGFTAMLPLYYPVHAKGRLERLGWLDPDRVQEAHLLRESSVSASGEINYPLHPLQCPVPETRDPDESLHVASSVPSNGPLNVVWVLIDALRPDAIDAVTTPALANFSADGQVFANHWSGGNSSRMGLFSMFYGLPGTYWHDFYNNQRPPVLMDEFRRHNYALMTSSAVGYGSPTLIDRTVFAGVTGLNPESDQGGVVKNRQVTADWLDWLAKRQRSADGQQPFLAFLYYDPPLMSEDDVDAAGVKRLPDDSRYTGKEKARRLWQRYRRGVHLVDGEMARVLDSLKAAGLDDNTLVIISSDHGYEFDDLGLGYYGHASNFGQYQLRATLMMHWPGRPPQVFRNRSSHFDLPATLLEGLFHCSNPPSDYSVGHNLFDGMSWDWIIAASYVAHAIVQPNRVMVSEPGGFAEVLGPDYRPPANGRLDAALIEESLRAMRRFYR
ncbi:MAG: sulfatase-like hydrolase/transferase [Gammaproteobacteria bacterium]